MKRLEWRIAARYLRSRRSSRLVSLITLIATAGVAVGVTALIVVMGVMNGLQSELREKILIASPHLRILTFGRGLRVDNWREALEMVRAHPDVEAAAPFVITQGMVRAGADYTEGVRVLGIDPDTATMSVTPLPRYFSSGDLRFVTQLANVDGGIILGGRVSDRLLAFGGRRLAHRHLDRKAAGRLVVVALLFVAAELDILVAGDHGHTLSGKQELAPRGPFGRVLCRDELPEVDHARGDRLERVAPLVNELADLIVHALVCFDEPGDHPLHLLRVREVHRELLPVRPAWCPDLSHVSSSHFASLL